MLCEYLWIYLRRKLRQQCSVCVCSSVISIWLQDCSVCACSSVIAIWLQDCSNTNCGTAHTGNHSAVPHTDTHCRPTQLNTLQLISQNSAHSDKVLQYACAFDYERCLSDRPRQKYVTPTTDTDTVLTNRPRTQQHNYIPTHPTVFTCVYSKHLKLSCRTAHFPLFTTA